MDADKDGKVTKEEFVNFHVQRYERIFSSLDKNKDSALDETELAKIVSRRPPPRPNSSGNTSEGRRTPRR